MSKYHTGVGAGGAQKSAQNVTCVLYGPLQQQLYISTAVNDNKCLQQKTSKTTTLPL